MTLGTTVVSSNGVPLDSSMIALPMRISHGRSGTESQPDAPVLEFVHIGSVAPCAAGDAIVVVENMASDPGGAAANRTWGDPVAMWGDRWYSWDGAKIEATQRFVGEVDEVIAVESEGEIVEWQVRAIGKLADLGRIGVRMELPAQDEVARVLAIAAKAGVTINIAGTPVIQLAPDELDRDCLDAVHQVCASTGGLFWQDRAGLYWYGTSNHRAGASKWVLPARAILDGLEWTKSTEQILNHLTIRYPREELPRLR